jgi:O-antigen/teichoic acid export membrane protein
MSKELINDSARYVFSLIIPLVIGVITIPIVTRLFSPGDYGNYVLIMGIVAFLAVVASSWMDPTIVRFFSLYKKNNEEDRFNNAVLRMAITSIGITLALFLIMVLLALPYLQNSLIRPLMLGAVLFILLSLQAISAALFNAKRKILLFTIVKSWYSIFSLLFTIILAIYFHMGIESLFLGAIISLVLVLPAMLKYSLGKFSLDLKGFSIPKDMVSYGMPLLCVSILDLVQTSSDKYILAYFKGSQEVGVYSVSYQIAQVVISNIITLFWLASSPIAYNIWENDSVEASRKFMTGMSRLYILICMPAVIGLSVLSRHIIELFSTSQYYGGYIVVPLIVTGAFIYGISRTFILGLTFSKKTGYLIYCSVFAIIASVSLNILLIPSLGYLGAGFSYLASFCAYLVLIIFVSRRHFKWDFPLVSFARVAIASLAMGAVVYCVSLVYAPSALATIFVGIFIGIIVYFTLLLVLKEVRSGEIFEAYRTIKGRKNNAT